MQQMKDILRFSLGQALDALTPLDRLAAAWPVAAGHAIAERSRVVALEGSVVTITVVDAAWRNQLESTADQLRRDLARVSKTALTDILFLSPAEPARRSAAAPNKIARKP